MRDWTGLDALETVQDVCPNTPLILVSGTLEKNWLSIASSWVLPITC